MGKIEDSIFENYKKAISGGNLDQAKKAVELAKVLRTKIEQEQFQDYFSEANEIKTLIGSFFSPFPYKYDPIQGIVVIGKTAVSLTNSENKFFQFLSQNQTFEENIKIISSNVINAYMWGTKVTINATKVLIRRLRQKIEVDPKKPQILINFYNKGYIFLGKRVFENE